MNSQATEQEVGLFVERARQFCHFVEGAAAMPEIDRLLAARQHLLELYTAATRLPEVELSGDDVDGEVPRVAAPQDWPGFGELDLYCEIANPYEESDMAAGDLSEDVEGTYEDVKSALVCWDRGAEHRALAVWDWNLTFRSHWGDHAIDALRALHRACAGATAISWSQRS